MSSFLQRIRESLFHVYDRKDLRRWEDDPKSELPIYGVYHVMLDTGWVTLDIITSLSLLIIRFKHSTSA